MKVLRLRLFQETACYKKPHALKVSETYPLPPYSTIKGMIHALLQADELIPMKFCVQGDYETMFSDYQTHYFFKNNKIEEFPLTWEGLDRHFFEIYDHLKPERKPITSMPIYRHLLFNVQLLIYISADEAVLDQIFAAFQTNTSSLSLGRAEDLVRMDECSLIEIEEADNDLELIYSAYVPEQLLCDKENTPYRLNSVYRIIENVRVWDKISVGYMEKGMTLEADEIDTPFYQDEQENPVFFY